MEWKGYVGGVPCRLFFWMTGFVDVHGLGSYWSCLMIVLRDVCLMYLDYALTDVSRDMF